LVLFFQIAPRRISGIALIFAFLLLPFHKIGFELALFSPSVQSTILHINPCNN
jgi:hypothetical protein